MTTWMPFIVQLVLGILFHIIPRRTRPTLYFAVTVDPLFSETPEARDILRLYRLRVWLFTFITLAFTAILVWQGVLHPAGIVLLGTFSQLFLLHVALYLGRKQTLAYQVRPNRVRVASLAPFNLQPPGGRLVTFGPLALLALTGLYAILRWSELPSRFPIHYGPEGPDRFVARTPENVAVFLGFLAAMWLVYVAMQYGIIHTMKRIHSQGKAAEAEMRFKRLSLILLQVSSYFSVIPVLVVFFLPAENQYAGRLVPWIAGGFVIFTFLCLGVMIRWGQGGSHLADGAYEDQAAWGDGTPDGCWKLGAFYYNPDDEAIIVETRFGIGQTLNWGRPQSWIFMALLLSPVAVIHIFLKD